jgi:hypothetical protein
VGGEVAHDGKRDPLVEAGVGASAQREDPTLELFAGALADPLAQDDGSGRAQRLQLVEHNVCAR